MGSPRHPVPILCVCPAASIVLALGSVLPGCRPAVGVGSGRPPAGSIGVVWTGPAAGRFTAPAEARWCPGDTLLLVLAVRRDTAFGMTLLPETAIRAGRYPVFPAQAFNPSRPQAAVGLRWFAETNVFPFEGTGGTVTVTARSASLLSGTLDVRLKRRLAPDSVHLTGSFTDLNIMPAEVPCGRAGKP